MEMNNALPVIFSFVLVNFCVRFTVNRKEVSANNLSSTFAVSCHLETIPGCKQLANISRVPCSMVFNTRTAENNSGPYFASHRIFIK